VSPSSYSLLVRSRAEAERCCRASWRGRFLTRTCRISTICRMCTFARRLDLKAFLCLCCERRADRFLQ
jgi:hypothetical protein